MYDKIKAYSVMHEAMWLLDCEQYYPKLRLSDDDVYNLLYYSDMANDRDFPLCCIVRGILFDQVSELYQILK